MASNNVILIVEDNPGDIELTTHALTAGGIFNEIKIAHDSDTARLLMRKDKPVLVLLDLNLPGSNGRALLSELHEVGENGMAIVVITGSDDSEDVRLAYSLGAGELLHKPFYFNDLLKILLRLGLGLMIVKAKD